MATDRERATEPPSPGKLKRARERGEVAFSREATAAAAGLSGAAVAAVTWPSLAGQWLPWVRSVFAHGALDDPLEPFRWGLRFLLPPAGSALAAALAVGLWQTGGLRLRWRWQPERLDPLRGLGRLVGRERLVDLGLCLLRLLGLLALWGVWLVGLRLSAPAVGWTGSGLGALRPLGRLILALAAATLSFAGLDVWLQRRRFRRRMRMTREEVIRERREQDGDPHLSAERRRRHRQLLAGGPLGLQRATALVVNPTHLAVALRYQPPADEAPVVVRGARGAAAWRLRLEAQRLGLPVVEHVSLARALIGLEPGTPVPEALYAAAAEVIRAVAALAPPARR